jgi:hypothetical protein
MNPEILVFKTNINTFQKVKIADALLSKERKIHKFNIDIEDPDKILRIETEKLKNENVVRILEKSGIWCEELV